MVLAILRVLSNGSSFIEQSNDIVDLCGVENIELVQEILRNKKDLVAAYKVPNKYEIFLIKKGRVLDSIP